MRSLLLDYGPAVLCWLVVGYKLPSVRRAPGDAGRRALWLTLFFLALAATALVPPVYTAVDLLLGRPNLARLLSNSLTLVACWAVLVFLAHLSSARTNAREPRWAAWLLGVALLTMAVLFLTAPIYPEALDFPERYAATPHVLAYRLVYLAYVGITDVTMTRLCWRYAKGASRQSLHLGLRLVTAGGVAGLLYVLNEASYLVAVRLSIAYPLKDPVTIHAVLVALTVALPVIGTILPALAPRLAQVLALRRLYPLWMTLCRSCPEIALLPPPSPIADALNPADLDFRLSRRVVEIRDGILTLRRYVRREDMELIVRLVGEAGLDAEDAEATVKAATIAAGRWAKARGQSMQHTASPFGASGGVDLATEIEKLERVARCYARSPVVRKLHSELASNADPMGENMPGSNRARRDGVTWHAP